MTSPRGAVAYSELLASQAFHAMFHLRQIEAACSHRGEPRFARASARVSSEMSTPRGTLVVRTTDYHTGGEPFRIVTDGVPALEGTTILERRRFAAENLDHVRELLVNEPRGHADMYGCFVCPPNDDDADLGVVFFHNAGYSTACGHGTIALVTWAIETGRSHAVGPETHVVVDVPSGRLETWASVAGGRVESVRFRNVPVLRCR